MVRSQFRLGPQDAVMFMVTLFWGLTFFFTKLGLRSLDPLPFAVLRTGSAVVLLNGLAAFQAWRGGASRLAWPDHLFAVVAGLLGMACFPFCFSLAMGWTSSANGGLIFGTTPVVVGLISLLLGLERFSLESWLGLLLSVTGILLLVGPKDLSFGGGSALGDLVMVGAMLVWALYTVLNRFASGRVSTLQLTAYASLWGFTGLTVLSLPQLLQTDWGQVQGISWLGGLLAGILGTGLSYVLWNLNVKRVGPARTAVFLNFVPVVALLSGYALLDEPARWLHLPASLAVLAGVFLTKAGNRTKRSPAGGPAEPKAPAGPESPGEA